MDRRTPDTATEAHTQIDGPPIRQTSRGVFVKAGENLVVGYFARTLLNRFSSNGNKVASKSAVFDNRRLRDSLVFPLLATGSIIPEVLQPRPCKTCKRRDSLVSS